MFAMRFQLILLATRALLVPYNNNCTIWENREHSRDAEILKKKKYQGCNKYIYILAKLKNYNTSYPFVGPAAMLYHQRMT